MTPADGGSQASPKKFSPSPALRYGIHGSLHPSALEGEVREGGGAERIKNHVQHPIGIRQHVIVPEADDAIPARLEPIGARLTFFGMLSAIDLDDEFRLGAKEIDDIGSERMLAAEAETFELFSPQARPQPDLSICRGEPQFACERYGCA